MKLLIIGIDGATFDLILPWAKAGKLPNLARLIDLGTYGELSSTLPPVTSPAWPSFMTGCNPGKHGVFDFIHRTGSDFGLVNATQIRRPTIWQRLSQADFSVGVLNVPVTYPPRPLSGYMVTGILSPKEGQICFPDDLLDRYRSELGDYRVAPHIQYKRGIEEEYIEDIFALIRSHGDWALHLMKNEPTDVVMVHFIALDIMMHALWRFMDHDHSRFEVSVYENAIRDGYRLVDEYIGRMLEAIGGETTVIVMSDHGFGPLEKVVNLNIFLLQKGLLHLKDDPWTRLKSAAFHRGFTPGDVYHLVERLGLQNLATRVSKSTRNQVVGRFLSFNNVDWQRTVAYSMGHVGQVYLNVAGREPHGFITKETYHEARQEVINALGEMTGSDGRPLVSKIILREESYHGPFAEQGPDLHLVLDDYRAIAFPLFAANGQIITDQIRGDSGCHRREGIFIAYGPDIQGSLSAAGADIIDLAPTILHLLGLPVPHSIDGRVLTEICSSSREVAYFDEEDAVDQSHSEGALSDEETAQVEERLRSLGYL